MKTCGIVAEFNPFHNGHARLVKEARASGFDRVIAVMSGNFVQRGEPAVFETSMRVAAALAGGVDAVIQLPVNYALSGAENFARGAVGILDKTGAVDSLVFGSECADISLLKSVSDIFMRGDFSEEIGDELKSGITYAAARENALRRREPRLADIVGSPNNILGIEYISALRRLNSRIEPVTFGRTAAHDCSETLGIYASASEIRRMIYSGEDPKKFLPGFYDSFDNENTVSFDKFEAAVLCKMRRMTAEEIALSPDISEGIENRIAAACRKASTLEELYFEAKTKRYTLARIRRTVMNSFIGITRDDAAADPPYIRILGMTRAGAEIFAAMKESASLPLVSKTSDISGLAEAAKRVFSLECAATDIYTACLRSPLPAGAEISRAPVIVKG